MAINTRKQYKNENRVNRKRLNGMALMFLLVRTCFIVLDFKSNLYINCTSVVFGVYYVLFRLERYFLFHSLGTVWICVEIHMQRVAAILCHIKLLFALR